VSCTDPKKTPPGPVVWLGLGLIALLAGCSSTPQPAPAPAPTPQPRAEPAPREAARPANPTPGPTPLAAGATVPTLAPPKPVRTHEELRKQVALRLVAANPDRTYMTDVPSILLAIPVLEVELFADGRIKQIHIVRRPGQAPETLQMAIDALHRAAPFGNVSRMPEPWKFTETFLFNNERRFKPRTLD